MTRALQTPQPAPARAAPAKAPPREEDRYESVSQYTLRQIVGIWAAAAVPMGVLAWVVAPLGAVACIFVMYGLPREAWERFAIWLVIGAAIYLGYSYSHSKLRQ